MIQHPVSPRVSLDGLPLVLVLCGLGAAVVATRRMSRSVRRVEFAKTLTSVREYIVGSPFDSWSDQCTIEERSEQDEDSFMVFEDEEDHEMPSSKSGKVVFNKERVLAVRHQQPQAGSGLDINSENQFKCVSCYVGLEVPVQPFAVLRPCNHKMCSPCLAELLAKKKPTEEIGCPASNCLELVESHVPHRLTVLKATGKVAHRANPEVHHAPPMGRDVYHNPNPQKDPFRTWVLQNREHDLAGKCLFYMAEAVGSGTSSEVVFSSTQCVVDLKKESCDSAEDEKQLCSMVCRLQRVLFPKKSAIPRKDDMSCDLPRLVRYIRESTDLSFRVLFALSHGCALTPDLQNQLVAENNADIMAVFVANDLLLQCDLNQARRNRRVPSLSQRAFGRELYLNGAAKNKAIEMLSGFRVSESLSSLKKRLDKKTDKGAGKKVLRGLPAIYE